MSDVDPFSAVPEPLRVSMQARGFAELTAVQRAVLEAGAQDQNVRISSQTGSGKTVAIGLVLAQGLMKPPSVTASSDAPIPPGPRTLVITPTRELAVQVRDELQWLFAELKTTVEVVTGGTDVRGEQKMLRRVPTILVGTPGRLLDHLRSGALSCARVEQVVLDEADRMLEMGFRDELDAIIDTLPEQRRSHLVSATFNGVVRGVADRFQGEATLVTGDNAGEANADIDHVAYLVGRGQSYAALVNALLLAHGQQVLVFVERRTDASELAERLSSDGFAALPFSGDLSQAQRTRTLHAFRNGTIQALCSTDVAARGIDIPDITMVVHMSPPNDADSYTHRAGRTGRAGKRGRSVLLGPLRAEGYIRRILTQAGVDAQWQPIPTPAKVNRAILKRTRKRLHTRLGAEEPPDEKSLAYAELLLADRDPKTVVATLLEMAEPELARPPMDVPDPAPAPPRRFDNRRRNRPFRGKAGPKRGGPKRGSGGGPSRGGD